MTIDENCVRLDLGPSRLDIDALLGALPVRTRSDIVDALEAGGLLYGSEQARRASCRMLTVVFPITNWIWFSHALTKRRGNK
jgi:hypothetical protein